MHLPTPPKTAMPWIPPPSNIYKDPLSYFDQKDDDDDNDDDKRRRLAEGGRKPQHCGTREKTCRGSHILSRKQQHVVEHYASLARLAAPPNLQVMNIPVSYMRIPAVSSSSDSLPFILQ